MRRTLLLISLLLLSAAAPGQDWLEASSDHFVIYSDQNEKALAGFAERLELFHSAMSFVFQQPVVKPSASNRVTIFIVSNPARIQELVKANNEYVAGIYLPRAGASVALVPKRQGPTDHYDLQPETILYHEYAHYHMSGLTMRRYPRWFSEGWAEYFAGVRFRPDSIGLGMPAEHRTLELNFADSVPIRKLLDYDGGVSIRSTRFDAFYGQSWRLFHYLMSAPERRGQVTKYETLLATGDTALEAAEGAFGDLDVLAVNAANYSNRSKLAYRTIERKLLPIAPISIRALPPGEAAMMSVRIRSDVGVGADEAAAVAAEARRVAGQYPQDAAVLTALAKAELDADQYDAAIVAADRALALDPGQVRAMVQKGYALRQKINEDDLPESAWKDLRAHWMKANKLENDNPVPLVEFYETYLRQGIPPTRNSIEGLEWAMTLAPFDTSIRWQAAQQMIHDERLADAVATLVPLAYSPHPGEFTERARAVLTDVEGRMAAAEAQP